MVVVGRIFLTLSLLGVLALAPSDGFAIGGRCRGRGCSPAPSVKPKSPGTPVRPPSKPSKPKPQKPIAPALPAVSLPDLSGCDRRGHGQARDQYASDVGRAMAEIAAGLQTAIQSFNHCADQSNSFVRQFCCNGVQELAKSQCQSTVLAKAAQDTKCAYQPPNCRRLRPVQCVILKKIEQKRVECCHHLKPQALLQLLQYCVDGSAELSRVCQITVTPTATAVPIETYKPVPTATSTPAPTATYTPVPAATETSVPTVTEIVEPTIGWTDTTIEEPVASGIPEISPTGIVE